jgi:hypothetical protein
MDAWSGLGEGGVGWHGLSRVVMIWAWTWDGLYARCFSRIFWVNWNAFDAFMTPRGLGN